MGNAKRKHLDLYENASILNYYSFNKRIALLLVFLLLASFYFLLPKKYSDYKGKWHKIDTNFKIKGSKLEVNEAPYSLSFSKDVNEPVTFLVGKDSVSFNPVIPSANEESLVVSSSTNKFRDPDPSHVNRRGQDDSIFVTKNRVTYKNVYKNTDLKRIAIPTGLRQNYVLKKPGHPTTFKETLNTSLTIKQEPDGSLGYYSGAKKVAFSPKPYLVDARGKKLDLRYHVQDDKKVALTLRLPSLKGLAYPIKVDPTIQIGDYWGFPNDEAFDTFVDSGSPTANYGTWQGAYVGYQPSTGGTSYMFIKFDLSRIPSGSTINSATLNLYRATSSGSPTLQVKSIDGAWSENSVTWNNKPVTGNYLGQTRTIYSWDTTVQFTISTLVSDWVRGIRANNGVSLERVSGSIDDYVYFYASEIATARAPYLEVTYTTPPPDSIPPISSITNPANGSFIGGTNYTIAGTSSDNAGGSGVNKVEVSTNGGSTWNLATLGLGGNWTYNWSLPANGNYNIKSRATDVVGNVETPSTGITVTVDKTLPTATISSPTAGQTLTVPFEIRGTATDANFKNYKVEYGSGSSPSSWTKIGVTETNPVNNGLLRTVNISALNGQYTFKLTVTDKANNRGTASVTANVSGQPAQSPHANYTQDPDQCAICHRSHTATLSKLLAAQAGVTLQADFCYQCHDGTGSQYNVKSAFDSNPSHHPIKDEYYLFDDEVSYPDASGHQKADHILDCGNCHNPHGDKKPDGSYYPKLLKATDPDNNIFYEGNDFCGACHGPPSNLIGGDYTTEFFYIPHNTMTPLPPSGTKIKCLNCHANNDSTGTEGTAPHGSDFDRLNKAFEELLCYLCHDDAANSENGINIKERFTIPQGSEYDTLSVRHNIEINEQVDADLNTAGNQPSKVECKNCHNPHKNDRLNKMADPDSPVANPDLFTDTIDDPKLWNNLRNPGSPKGVAVFQPAAIQLANSDDGWPPYTGPLTERNGKDSFISSGNMGSNYGVETTLNVGYKSGNQKMRTLIDIVDLSQIPSGATVTKATLSWPWLKLTDPNLNIEIYRITSPWLEDTVTWNNKPAVDPTSYVSSAGVRDVSSGFGFIAWDIINLVNDWVNGAPNFGFMMVAPAAEAQTGDMYLEIGNGTLGSSEWPHNTNGAGEGTLTNRINRPALTVEYTNISPQTVVDSIGFCLKCHDGDPPPGVIVPNLQEPVLNGTRQDILNVAYNYLRTDGKADMHGAKAGTLYKSSDPIQVTSYYEGEIIGPYYAGMDPVICTDCHDPHGSGNRYHLKESINWTTEINLYDSGATPDYVNVCGSCHRFYHVPLSQSCSYCHFHGAEADSDTTTNF